MSVQPNEGNLNPAAGEVEQPTPPTSPPAGQPLPDYVVALQSQIAETNKLIKGLQKGTDKQIGQVRGDIKRILELKEKGYDETQIQRELWIDSQIEGESASSALPAGSGESRAGLDVQSIDTALELPANDSRVTNLKLLYVNDPFTYLREGVKLKASFNAQPLSPAEQLPPEGAQPNRQKDTPAQMETDYQKELAVISSTKRGDEKLRLIAGLKAKYREKGLQKL